jgi:hypothetical protein
MLGAEVAPAADDREALDWTASPQEYLEKIFQLPLNLGPMESEGYGRLIREIMPPLLADDRSYAGLSEEEEEPDPMSGEVPGDADADPEEDEDEELELDHANLEIEPEELAFVERLWPLMPSPRAVKRLSNVYRYIRAQVSPADLESFTGRDLAVATSNGTPPAGEYQAVLLLLAILIGRPDDAPALFSAVMSPEHERWRDVLADVRDVPDAVLSALQRTSEGLEDYPVQRLRNWVPVVKRFSFSLWETAGPQAGT